MSAALDRILFAIVFGVADAIEALRRFCAAIEARLPSWAQDEDNRLLAYILTACVVCMIALVRLP